MNNSQSSLICALGGWGLAAVAGLLGAIMLMLLGDWRLIQAIFAAIVITIFVGALVQWIICRPIPVMGNPPVSTTPPNPTPSSKESAQAAVAAAKSGEDAKPSTPAAVAVAAAKSGVKPSAALAGEAELAARKGTWKYEAAPAAAPAKAAPAAAPAKAAAAASADKDYDGDGVVEGTDEGKRPEALSEAREGGADNLKEIKGIGPKLEKLCNRLGFFHFDQIANWTADEVAWVDANLEGFKGRVSRDEWVSQAKVLAAGGETEFSKRVDDGDVY